MEYYVRIKPSSRREVSVVLNRTFERRRGWYFPFEDVDPKIAKLLTKLRTITDNDANPATGSLVFDVLSRESAEALVNAETTREDPRGTLEAPVLAPNTSAPELPATAGDMRSEDVSPRRASQRPRR